MKIQNPVRKNVLNISVSEKTEIEIYTLTGKRIIEEQLEFGNNTLEFSVPAGIYLLNSKINNIIYSEKLVKPF